MMDNVKVYQTYTQTKEDCLNPIILFWSETCIVGLYLGFIIVYFQQYLVMKIKI